MCCCACSITECQTCGYNIVKGLNDEKRNASRHCTKIKTNIANNRSLQMQVTKISVQTGRIDTRNLIIHNSVSREYF